MLVAAAVTPLLAGCAGFLCLLAFDFAASRGLAALKWTCFILAVALFGYGLAGVLLAPGRLAFPAALRAAAGLPAAAFLFLLVVSTLVELPLRQVLGGGRMVLVDTGTYALVRHPGVLWFLLFHLSLFGVSGAPALLAAAVLWTAFNAGLAAAEELLFLPRMFGPSYRLYQRSVPFLIPTAASIRRCVRTLVSKEES
jgi:protein-S-isoprenylcysteine O-methyltransferase Ste14